MCSASQTSSYSSSWFWRLSAVRTVADSLRQQFAMVSAGMARCVPVRLGQRYHWNRLRWRLDDLSTGLTEGYPACCVLRFATAWQYHGQAWRRGTTAMPNSDEVFVSCRVFHR